MTNVPVPYPHELIYSVIARTGINEAIVSPKQLLDEVFNNRKVVATLDLPSHVGRLSEHLSKTKRYSATSLIYQHTLFPFYAPFIQEATRQKALRLMESSTRGAVHLMLGAAASRVKSVEHFRICPECAQKQVNVYGETFWDRRWFIPGLTCCTCSKPLVSLSSSWRDHRHAYVSCPIKIEGETSNPPSQALIALCGQAESLLEAPEVVSPTFEQWTFFYRGLASDYGLTNGRHIAHDRLVDKVLSHMPSSILRQFRLNFDVKDDSNWLRTMFRKHRKSFSALQHMAVWVAFKLNMPVTDIIGEARRCQAIPKAARRSVRSEGSPVSKVRAQWIASTKTVSLAKARHKAGHVYAWLYRHDRQWLMQFNAKRRTKNHGHKFVNWQRRDRILTRNCLAVLAKKDSDLSSPRLSKSWLLSQLPHGRSCAKSLKKLPLLSHCLTRYSETISDYQIRRLTQAVVVLSANHMDTVRWRLLRISGLSEERITNQADEFINRVIFSKDGNLQGC